MQYRLIAALLMLGSALAFDWKSKPFPNWDDNVVFRMLTDSPWAKQGRARIEWRKQEDIPFSYKDVPGADRGQAIPDAGGSPVGGIGKAAKSRLPDHADLIVRWASALPIHHAKALYQQRSEKLGADKING